MPLSGVRLTRLLLQLLNQRIEPVKRQDRAGMKRVEDLAIVIE